MNSINIEEIIEKIKEHQGWIIAYEKFGHFSKAQERHVEIEKLQRILRKIPSNLDNLLTYDPSGLMT